MEVTLEEQDLDAALALPWNTQTCPTSLCAVRHGLYVKSMGEMIPDSTLLCHHSPLCKTIRNIFDNEYGVWGRKDGPRFRLIRKSLPLTIALP